MCRKVLNLKQGLKTKDLCTSKSVMTVNITHWDAGVCACVCICMSVCECVFVHARVRSSK